MGKEDMKKELSEILNNKKFLNAVCVLIILAFVLIAISFLSTNRKKTVQPTDGSNISQGESDISTDEYASYEEEQKNSLESLLSKINGVGKVEVMMNYKSGEVKVPALDTTKQVGVTEESDSNGGKRVSNQDTDETKVVMTDNGNGNEPVILQKYNPELTGIIIVAEGAEDAKIKYEVQTAVSSLFGISLNKVNVYPMKN